MSHVNLYYHIVWRTKNSSRTINENHERELFAYIYGICKTKKCQLFRINSMPDHIHMCIGIHPTIAVSDFVKIIKQESSKWIDSRPDYFPMFTGWGNGYAGFTYSEKELPSVIAYIKNQKEHHKTKSFKEEYEEWLTEMGQNPEYDMLLKDE